MSMSTRVLGKRKSSKVADEKPVIKEEDAVIAPTVGTYSKTTGFKCIVY
jgi:hypothetical protein